FERPERSASRREDYPDFRPWIPRGAAIIAQKRGNREPGLLEGAHHLRHRQGAEAQREAVGPLLAAPALDEFLIEDREAARAILTDGFNQRHARASAPAAPPCKADAFLVLVPGGKIGHKLEAECAASAQHSMHGRERGRKIAFAQQ